MTHALVIGDTTIAYDIRRSDKAHRQRIIVTPERVEVVVPAGTPPERTQAFLMTKRRWVFDSVMEVEEKHRRILAQRYASGAKLQYRGRWLMLDVQSADVPAVQIRCRSKFHVAVPHELSGKRRLDCIRAAFDGWLKARAERDMLRFGRRHEEGLDVQAAGFRLAEAKHRWGTCGRDDLVRIHWRLIQAPAAAMEYVVAHEVAHLLHRHHGPEFWRTLARTLPDWEERKELLERWEHDHRAV